MKEAMTDKIVLTPQTIIEEEFLALAKLKAPKKEKKYMRKIGEEIGTRYSAKLLSSFSKHNSDVEVVKFLCNIVWPLMFAKKPENLKTDKHKNFIITDKSFSPINHVLVDDEMKQKLNDKTALYEGVFEGILKAYGYKFNIVSKVSKSLECLLNFKLSLGDFILSFNESVKLK